MKRLIPAEYRKQARATMAVIAFAALLTGILVYLDRIGAVISFTLDTLSPFFVGGALAFIQLPIDRKLNGILRATLFRKKPDSKAVLILSALISVALLLVLIGLFFAILFPQVYASIESLITQISRVVSENDTAINDMLLRLGLLTEDAASLNSAWRNLLSYATSYLNVLVSLLLTSYNVIYQFIFGLFIGLIVSIYLLLDRERLARQSKKLCYAFMKPDSCETLFYWMRRTNRVFAGFTTGKIIDSVIVGFITYAFMLAAGLEYSVLISVVIGVTNILPFFGPFIGAIPSILILLIVNPMSALKFAIFILILQQVDGNIIGPKILGDYTGITPLLTMLAIILGSAFFGFVGLLVSVPVCSVLYAIFKTVVDRRLTERGLPTDSDSYENTPPEVKTEEG